MEPVRSAASRRLLGRLPTSTLMGLAFIVTAVVTAGLLLEYHRIVARRYLEEEGARYGEILAEPILSASERFLRDGTVGAIQQMMEDTGSNRAVREIALVGGDGRVIASNRREWVGQDDSVVGEPAYRETAAAARASFHPEHRLTDGGTHMVLVSPLLFQGSSPILTGGSRGVLYLKVDHESRLLEISASILKRGVFSALLILAVCLALLAWVRATLTRPILEVAEYLRAFAAGRAGEPPRSAGPREVAQLLEDVGRMARDLQAKEAALLQSEEHLREAQRMESVASLAGALAHDFNNLLTGILGYTRLLLDRVGPGDPIRRQLSLIETSAARAADLTGQLLTFSRRAASRPEPVDLGRALEPALATVRRGLPDGIDMVDEAAPGLWAASVDVPQMQKVIEALCVNAQEAMTMGGRITVGLANRILAPEDCRGRLDARPGRFVTVSVADTGRGLDPEVRRRLFEPFVTTKKGAGPAGFGLATAYGLVKGHHGWIEVAPGKGGGTVVTLFLPAVDADAPASGDPAGVEPTAAAGTAEARNAAGTPPAATRPRTVLAVDDEPTILALAKDVLELDGYHVLTARNGEEALRIYRDHPGGIDLVLLDLTMPVMGGVECFKRLRAIDPAVRVVISSGFSSESSAAEVLREGAVDFLQKPYEIQDLARSVAAAIDRRGARAAAAG